MDAEVYLAHHGIKGQKWGLRRYQNKDGTLTALGRKRLGIDKSSRQLRKEAKEKKKQEEIAKKEVTAKQKLREEMVRDPRKLYKYKDTFTKEEVQGIMEDIEFDRKIKDIRKTDHDRMLTQMQQVVDFSKKTSDLLTNAKSIYNLYAEAYNTFSKDGKKLTKIGDKPEAPKSADIWNKELRETDWTREALAKRQDQLSNEQLKDIDTRLNNLNSLENRFNKKAKIDESNKQSKSDTSNQQSKSDSSNKQSKSDETTKTTKPSNDHEYIDKITKNGETRYIYEDERGNVSSFSSNSNVLKSSASTKINELPKAHTSTSDWYKTAVSTKIDELPGSEREKTLTSLKKTRDGTKK